MPAAIGATAGDRLDRPCSIRGDWSQTGAIEAIAAIIWEPALFLVLKAYRVPRSQRLK